MRSSSGVRWGRLRRAQDVGAARVEFAVIVAIFATWVIVSVAMFQQGVRDVYAAASGEGTITGPSTPGTAPLAAQSDLPAAPPTATPTTAAPAARVPTTAAPQAPAPTTFVPSAPGSPTVPESPTRAGPATSGPSTEIVPPPLPPTSAAPTPNPTTPAPPPPTPPIPPPPPPTPELTTPVPPTPPVAGPTLALTASVAKKGTLAANLLTGLNPAATLAATAITSGGGDLVWTTVQGDYVFNAPNGRSTTVIRFTYVQNGIPVTDNTLTISTG